MKKKYIVKCLECGEMTKGTSPKGKLCSHECRKKRLRKQRKLWRTTLKGKLSTYSCVMKYTFEKYPTTTLVFKLHQALEKINIIEDILKKRGVKIEEYERNKEKIGIL
jgi:hypothetical protein